MILQSDRQFVLFVRLFLRLSGGRADNGTALCAFSIDELIAFISSAASRLAHREASLFLVRRNPGSGFNRLPCERPIFRCE